VQPLTNPIVVRVVEEPVKSTTVGDVILGAFGLTGVMVLAALVLGAVLGGVLIWIKKLRVKYDLEPVPDSEALRVTPSSSTP
jgi:membrane protein CcdC involved in cytochrome C biogenesis